MDIITIKNGLDDLLCNINVVGLNVRLCDINIVMIKCNLVDSLRAIVCHCILTSIAFVRKTINTCNPRPRT